MQPLKRFTQCGSLTMLFAVFIVLFGVSSTALTTFGKTNPNQLQPPTPPPAKGKECNTHADCAPIQNTSCVKDPLDAKTRCLCGDNVAPYNGQCNAKAKGLRHLCLSTSECDDGMICAADNATRTSGISKIIGVNQSIQKQCLCDEENGWEENIRDLTCNGGEMVVLKSALVPVLSVIASFILSMPSLRCNINH